MTATTADLLRLAPTAIRAGHEDFPTDPGRARIAAANHLRTACTPDGGPQPDLRDAVAAVDAALAQQTTIADLDRYRQRNPDWFKGWAYQFPNGITVSVTIWAHQVGTFELLSSDRSDGNAGLIVGLSTDEVRAKLIEIATRTR